MRRQVFGGSLPLLVYAFFVATLFLFVKGYQFNTDDQAEHLPQIYQMLDPALYPHDYYVNAANSVFTVRFYYEKLALVVAKTVGLEWGLFFLTLCSITLMAYSFARMAEKFFGNRIATLLAPLFAIILFHGFTISGVSVMYASFISSTLAKGLASYGLWKFMDRKAWFAGLILGLSTLVQPLVGLQLFLVLSAYLILVDRNMKRILGFGATYIPVAACMLGPVLYTQFFQELPADKNWFYKVFLGFRNHVHYYPHLFPTWHYVKFCSLVAVGLVSYYVTKPADRWFYPVFIGINVVGLLVYSVGLEFFDTYALAKIQWFKMTIWMEAFSAITLAGLVGQLLTGFSDLNILRKWLPVGSLVLGCFILVGITNSKYLPEKYADKYMIGNRDLSDLERMHLWISENTDKSAVVLVSPDNNGFSCQAKRSMPIHFQAIVHQNFFIIQWYEDYKEIYGVSLENLKGNDPRKHAVELYQTRNYAGNKKQIDYRLDDAETCQFTSELGSVVHQEGKWILTKFQPNAPS